MTKLLSWLAESYLMGTSALNETGKPWQRGDTKSSMLFLVGLKLYQSDLKEKTAPSRNIVARYYVSVRSCK